MLQQSKFTAACKLSQIKLSACSQPSQCTHLKSSQSRSRARAVKVRAKTRFTPRQAPYLNSLRWPANDLAIAAIHITHAIYGQAQGPGPHAGQNKQENIFLHGVNVCSVSAGRGSRHLEPDYWSGRDGRWMRRRRV